MRLNPGVTLAYADDVLRRAELEFRNALGSQDFHGDYINAVYRTYSTLKVAFAAPDLGGGLHSVAYWNLMKIGRDRAAFTGPIQDPDHAANVMRAVSAENYALRTELETQVRALEEARAEFGALEKLAARPGLPVVYDTNMLNHWRQPGDILWREVLRDQGEDTRVVRLVVPLQVIDELDRQKYGEGELAKRAATAIRYLERVLDGTPPGEAVELRPGVSLEVWVDTDDRGSDVDLAILRCAGDLAGLCPDTGARVLTNDFGMRLRARQMGLTPVRLPDDHRKASPPAAGKPAAAKKRRWAISWWRCSP
ncbi:PIN domain-containing protein [Kribbella sp. NPDC049584]|uniref:PIN domain-containing protein n=1 Tax=Kribbella sp. NPDC049584 TaxID=3154833 RepID=UPI00342D3491